MGSALKSFILPEEKNIYSFLACNQIIPLLDSLFYERL
jgi:hypothetical protein